MSIIKNVILFFLLNFLFVFQLFSQRDNSLRDTIAKAIAKHTIGINYQDGMHFIMINVDSSVELKFINVQNKKLENCLITALNKIDFRKFVNQKRLLLPIIFVNLSKKDIDDGVVAKLKAVDLQTILSLLGKNDDRYILENVWFPVLPPKT